MSKKTKKLPQFYLLPIVFTTFIIKGTDLLCMKKLTWSEAKKWNEWKSKYWKWIKKCVYKETTSPIFHSTILQNMHNEFFSIGLTNGYNATHSTKLFSRSLRRSGKKQFPAYLIKHRITTPHHHNGQLISVQFWIYTNVAYKGWCTCKTCNRLIENWMLSNFIQ